MDVLGLEKFRINTIQTEDENIVCSPVERALVGAVENEEHLGGGPKIVSMQLIVSK